MLWTFAVPQSARHTVRDRAASTDRTAGAGHEWHW